jgi:hypothetical protein
MAQHKAAYSYNLYISTLGDKIRNPANCIYLRASRICTSCIYLRASTSLDLTSAVRRPKLIGAHCMYHPYACDNEGSCFN